MQSESTKNTSEALSALVLKNFHTQISEEDKFTSFVINHAREEKILCIEVNIVLFINEM